MSTNNGFDPKSPVDWLAFVIVTFLITTLLTGLGLVAVKLLLLAWKLV